MNLCDLTLPTPAENLACDEVLLDWCEGGAGDESLRFWEPREHFAVVGYANHISREVNLEFCRQNHIPILRRCSGGGTVLQGPGCLNYSLILRVSRDPALHSISGTNQYILHRQQSALTRLFGVAVETRGQTDLAIGGIKFSGNAQRRRKHSILFHGTFLLHMDISLIEKTLPMPSKQPDYRDSRSHAAFLLNLDTPAHLVKTALTTEWRAQPSVQELPVEYIKRLAAERYLSDAWNLKF